LNSAMFYAKLCATISGQYSWSFSLIVCNCSTTETSCSFNRKENRIQY
jgi:hypothetical protein